MSIMQVGPISFPHRFCGSGTSYSELVGCSTFMYNGPELEPVRYKFGRPSAWAKIFFNPLEGPLANYVWYGTHPPQHESNSLLLEATAIQNIAAFYGMAPRVYGIFLVEGKDEGAGLHGIHPAQLCYYETRPPGTEQSKMATFAALTAIGKQLGYESFRELKGSNCRSADQWVDFQGWRFTPDYEGRLAQRVYELGRFQGPKGSYQSVPELGVGGRRDSARRIRRLGLDKIAFDGRTVLDLGCNTGAFCRYALNRGASRAVGIDSRGPVQIATELSAYLENYNADYLALDLRHTTAEEIRARTGIEQFDIVLFLAMKMHTGYPSWIPKMCRGTLVFETHPHPSPAELAEIRDELGQGFGWVDYIGKSGDRYPRVVFWASN